MFKNSFEVFSVFLRLGLTSFGGPVAHLGFFHDEFVSRRKWLSESAYADLVALCQFLPGPASSQVGMALGLHRAGIFGAFAAWAGFTLPSAILLTVIAFGITNSPPSSLAGELHALKVVAVAIVAQALWGMGTKLCPDKERMTIAALTCLATLLSPSAWIQVAAITVGGVLGIVFLNTPPPLPPTPSPPKLSKKAASVFLGLFGVLLFLLPLAAKMSQAPGVMLFDAFYRVGALVFGGGHVVLPLLQAEVVPPGWVSPETFMAGYGAAQAVPGPLFTFSAYLGAASRVPPSGWLGASLCLIAVFLPSFLLVLGALPFWERLREFKSMRQAMAGINAVVVGLLLAAFYDPVWTHGVLNARDFSLALFAWVLLTFWKAPSWAVVLLSAGIGGALL